MRGRSFIVWLTLGTAVAAGWMLVRRGPASPGTLRTIRLEIGAATVVAEVADTPAAQARGLSGRIALADGRGMLFPQSSPGRPAFWMKAMRIPIDFLWIRDAAVAEITAAVPPASAPGPLPIYRPSRAVDAVLEVPAGWTERANIRVGDAVRVQAFPVKRE